MSHCPFISHRVTAAQGLDCLCVGGAFHLLAFELSDTKRISSEGRNFQKEQIKNDRWEPWMSNSEMYGM